jgi:hypothetical protein
MEFVSANTFYSSARLNFMPIGLKTENYLKAHAAYAMI